MARYCQKGGSVLYLRGPAMSWWATKRFEGLESARPKNVEVKSLKVVGSTSENAYNAVCSWLSLSKARPEGTQLIVSQNADFIDGARTAFEINTSEPERTKWLALPRAGVGVSDRSKPLVDQGQLCAAVVTLFDDGHGAGNARASDDRRFAARRNRHWLERTPTRAWKSSQ